MRGRSQSLTRLSSYAPTVSSKEHFWADLFFESLAFIAVFRFTSGFAELPGTRQLRNPTNFQLFNFALGKKLGDSICAVLRLFLH